MNTIYFDMDGTIADLYTVSNVFTRLDSFDATPYSEALPIEKNISLLKDYKSKGYKVVILSCLSKITNDKMDKDTCTNKDKWLNRYVGKEYIDERIYIPYTKHKEDYVKESGILVDDDATIRQNWSWASIAA